MVLTYTQEHVYKHPWDRVSSAAFRKFTDPETPAVLSHITDVHTLARRVDPSKGLLQTVRSLTVRSPPLPYLARRIVGRECAVCHCVERTAVDARSRSMEVVARNFSLRSLIEVEERSLYNPHPDRPDEWTLFRQETSIRCRPFSALAAVAGKVEQRCAERFVQNSAKGREVVERICKYLEAAEAAASSSATTGTAAASGI